VLRKRRLYGKEGARQIKDEDGGQPWLWQQQPFHLYPRWFSLASLPTIIKGQDKEEC
jgi:hypothetical protein